MTFTYCICSDSVLESPGWHETPQQIDTVFPISDKGKVLFRWPATSPTPEGLPADAVLYTHAEVLALLASPEWAPPDPELP